MNSSNSIFGEVKLLTGLQGMPNDGLTVSKIRVELFEEKLPDSAWISELVVLGELPWREGEERRVEVRILTDEFRKYVWKNKPELQVRRGSQLIGSLVVESSNN